MQHPGIIQVPRVESMDIGTDNIIANLSLEDIKYI